MTEPLPANVAAERVIDFDYFNPQTFAGEDVYAALKRLHAGPDIQWTPRNGGHWIITRAEDQRWMRTEPEVFSRTEFVLPPGSMNTLMPPTNVDPPYHARFRAVLNPYFTPGTIRRMESDIRALTIGLIEQLQPLGRCDFVEDFGRIMPVLIFLNILGLPTERRGEFLDWGRTYINASDIATKDEAAAQIARFLNTVLDDRQANPRDDLFTSIANWRNNPRYQSEAEVIGMAMVSFLAGLDTVTGALSFTMRHLATHPEARQRLMREPGIIPKAAEEYLRRHGLSNSGRVVMRDIARNGVNFKRGDYVLVVDALAAMDERAYANPLEIDFDRDNRVHDTFGSGIHRCLGEHLARMELIVFLEEWIKRIPDFSPDPELPALTYSGVVMGVSQLGLIWH